MRLCEVPDCNRKHRARGMCEMHYKRWLTNSRLAPDLPPFRTGWPGMAVSRYTWRGISANDLPAVWAAEDAEKRRSA